MVARVHSVGRKGMLLRGLVLRSVRTSIAYGEILTAERMPSGIGFRLHGRGWEKLVVLVQRGRRRGFEEELRARGVLIVDEWGARIDASQFDKEADPEFNRDVDDGFPPFLLGALGPNVVLRWWDRRSMRQSSEDAAGE